MTTPDYQPGQLPTYEVLVAKLSQTTALSDVGSGIDQLHVIPYKITSGKAKGSIRSVRVTEDDFTPEGVRMAIEEDLSTVHGLSQIGS